MNNTISELFSGLLGICHTVVIIAALWVVGMSNGNPFVSLWTVGLVAAYIFAVGLLCTLLAIREHLEKLVELQTPKAALPAAPTAPSPKPVPAPSVFRVRQEGYLSK